MTQRLVRTTDGRRAAVREYLRFTPDLKDAILAQPPARVVAATRHLVREHGRPLTADLDALRAAGRIDEREYRLFRGLGTQADTISLPLPAGPDHPEPGEADGPG